jgi:hypothetical protein
LFQRVFVLQKMLVLWHRFPLVGVFKIKTRQKW